MHRNIFVVLVVICAMLLAPGSVQQLSAGTAETLSRPLPKSQLEFVPNKGQFRTSNGKPSSEVLYVASGGGTTCFLTRTSIQYVQSDSTKHSRMDVEFVGANPSPNIAEVDTTDGELNYYIDGGRVEGVRAVRKLVYYDLYPNIDLVMYSTGATMKYDLVVHPGGDPRSIVMRYVGAKSLAVTRNGDVRASTTLGEIKELRPYTYQLKQSRKIHDFDWLTPQSLNATEVSSEFVRRGNNISFRIARYDATRDLVIDPQRIWSTYYGGVESDGGAYLCLDAKGNVVMGGRTKSPTQIATPGAHSESLASTDDAFIVKFDENGKRLWATYFGGDSTDYVEAVAVDSYERLFACGFTGSTNGIGTAGVHQTMLRGTSDIFLASFDMAGRLVWSTYFGGDGAESSSNSGRTMTVTSNDNIAVVGSTTSSDGIATLGAHKMVLEPSSADGFLAVFNPSGTLQWATYIGGSGSTDGVQAVGVDQEHHCLVIAGNTDSPDNIATPGAHQETKSADVQSGDNQWDGFIMSFTNSGVRRWGTYFGGAGFDDVWGMATSVYGEIYVVGSSSTDDGITTPGTHQERRTASGTAPFIMRFTSDGIRLWGAYYGGEGPDFVTDVFVHNYTVYIVGGAASTSGIATPNGFQTTRNGVYRDGFLAAFDMAGQLVWGTYYGGTSTTQHISSIHLSDNSIYVCGHTNSSDAISTPGSYQESLSGESDAFLVKFCEYANPILTVVGGNKRCYGDRVSVIAGSYSGDSSGQGLRWYLDDIPVDRLNDSLVFNSTTMSPGIHRIQVTVKGRVCEAIGQIDIEVFPRPTLLVSNDTIVCPGKSLALLAAASDGTPPYRYAWTPNQNISDPSVSNPVVDVVSDITYQCVVTDANGCTDAASIHIGVLTGPVATITPAGPYVQCGDAPFVLRANKGMQKYLWSDGSTADTLVVTAPGLYSVTTTHASGCTVKSKVVSVAMFPQPSKPIITLVGADLTSTFAAGYQWSVQGATIQGATAQTHTPLVDGFYTVTIVDANGCPATSDPFSYGVAARATFAVGAVPRVDPNNTVDVPILIKNTEDLDLVNAQQYIGALRYNGSMMLPMSGVGGTLVLPDSAVAGSSDRMLTFSGRRGAITTGTLQTIQFATLLGNDTCTTLELMDVSFPDAIVDITLENNTFCESGICITEGEVRLVDGNARLALLPIQPNPVIDNVEIRYELFENGHTQLMLTDLLGNTVSTLVDAPQAQGRHSIQLDVHRVASGWYRVVLRTPSTQRNQLLIVGGTP